MKNKPVICVYAGSSSGVDGKFIEAARGLGELCARHHVGIVCGGGNTGLMDSMIRGCRAAGGEVTGVLPEFMIANDWHSTEVTELVITPDMHSRKQRMIRDAVAAVALPGGVGTFEELFEILTWRQLGLFGGTVIIVNTDGYYDSVLAMLRSAIEAGFMKKADAHLWEVASTPAEAMDIIDILCADA